ncbi:MAG: Bro-N domain-containing protein [Enterocloster sp.]
MLVKIFLTESGVFKLIFKSRKPNADAFSDWVTDEVLPALHKPKYIFRDHYLSGTQYRRLAMRVQQNAGRLFERIMKSEGIPPHEIAMAVRDIFLRLALTVPDMLYGFLRMSNWQ